MNSLTIKIKEIIDTRYNERVNNIILSKELKFSRSHLCNTFKKDMYCTIHQYLTEIRMLEAMSLMRENTKIEAVSILVGYKSKKDFYKNFKKIYRNTPRNWYKRNVLSNNS